MRKTIFITAVGSFSAASVIKRYRELDFRVLGCDIYPAEWVVASGEVDRFFQAPYATSPREYLAFVERVCREEQVDFLIPLTDVEVDVLNGWRSQVKQLGVTICMSDRDAIDLCRNKGELGQYLASLGICRTIPGQTLSETDLDTIPYPAVLKPFRGRSSQGLCFLNGPEDGRDAKERLASEADNYLVQPRIPGHVVTVDVVRNPDTGQTVCLPRRELLRTPNGAGTSVYVFQDAYLEEQCRNVAQALKIRGCVNFEFIEDSREEGENRWHFLECNPRFSGGVAFSALAGYDMAGNHLRCFSGEALDPMGKIPGQYLVKRYTEYCMKVEE